jgi:DNA-binding transcriptional ArsR family regulator
VTRSAERDVYAAIADPTRREILRLLSGAEITVNDLAAHFPVTRPAISQHLAILREASLVTYRQEGRTRYYRSRAEPLHEVIDWLAYFDVFWNARLIALRHHLEKEP